VNNARSTFLATVLLFCAFGLVTGAPVNPPAPDAANRPNVIIILSDDQGYGDLSAHGNPVLKTPNLDRLHSQSVRLTDFHVAPMCTPTRGQLLTGVDALRNGATSVTAGRSFLRPGFPTMAEVFKASGYRTAIFGKWHLGDSWPNLPHHRGFEEAVYHLGWGVNSLAATWENDNFDDRFFHNGVLKEYQGYCTDVWFDLAMNWMKDRKQRNEPFFLYLPTNAPHGPLWVAGKYKQPYEGKGPAAFFGMIANLDENVGRLDAFLGEQGLAEDTIVIFMNDNGGTAGVRTYNAGMRAQKTQVYDGGHRAACFIRWPNGKLRKPGDLDALAQVQDLLPTLIELCELKKPKTAKFDGASLAAWLRGKADRLPDRMLVVQYGQTPAKYDAAVMWNKWRLVKGKELYDLARDPGQQTDIAAEDGRALRPVVGRGRTQIERVRSHHAWRATGESGHVDGRGLGRRILRQRQQLPAPGRKQERHLAREDRAQRQLSVLAAPLAERGRRCDHGRRARIQSDRRFVARGPRAAHRQSAAQDRRLRSNTARNPGAQRDHLRRAAQIERDDADADLVLRRPGQSTLRRLFRLRQQALSEGYADVAIKS
jgi:arylsulfatase A-like enzyme